MTEIEAKSKTSVQVFEHPQFGKVRTVEINGEPWFVGKDVADALGYDQTNNMIKRLAEEDFISSKLEGMNMNSIIINESGLYTAIIGSQLPKAKAFKSWVTHEVLPSIRKHGAYVTPSLIDQMLADPDTMIRLLTELKEERAKSAALADKVEEQAIELNESERYWTIAKYNRMNKLGWSLDVCKKAGKEASRYARLHNYQIKRCETNDERFGWVNSYPLDMLKILFKK